MQINQIAWWLVIIGALNWLWAGIFSQDLVGMIFGLTIISKLVYILVGLSGLWLLLQKLGIVK
jgi:uncharacterized membrane protein YuzA (DUF378 family)